MFPKTARRFAGRSLILLLALGIFSALPLSARSWKEICTSGTLRVLMTRADLDDASRGISRCEMPIHRERALLRAFAEKHHLRLVYVPAASFSSLFPMLERDQGDLIAASLSATRSRSQKFLLSVPFDTTNEVVFAASSMKYGGKGFDGLRGRTGQFLPGTSYAENFALFYGNRKDVAWRLLPQTISHEALIDKVASGEIDYSVLNECDLNAISAYRTDVRKLFPLRSCVPLVFAANIKSTELIRQLDLFIAPPPQNTKPEKTAKSSAADPATIPRRGDLAAIRDRGYVRVLMRNEFFGCYMHRGEMCGFEYELARRFAKSIGVDLVTVIPPDFDDMVKYLEAGKGDFIAANFSCTAARISAYPNLNFCAPYGSVKEVLVGRTNEKITNISDLAGRHIHVRKGNSYYQTLLRYQKAGNFIIETVPENESMWDIFKKTASGKYDLTVSDETYMVLAEKGRYNLKKLLVLSENNRFSWVVRKKNPQLAAAVDAFFKKEYRGTFYNILWKRYYDPSMPRIKKAEQALKPHGRTISPYDKLFQKYGTLYGFDWCFLAAQAYQETRFKADTVNSIGAAGLMQVMPAAAKEVGVRQPLTVPENGIRAGTMYLAKLRKRFDGKIKPEDLLCLTLASYNAGYGHVLDARRLAAQKGWNPDVWFDHTEKALALLEEQRYASRARFGYCRASETIPYVRNVMLNYYHFKKMSEAQAAKDPAAEPKRKSNQSSKVKK